MSALARYYQSKNAVVGGYDKTPTALTKQMEAAGINIHYEDSVALLDKDAQLVIYTPAVPKDSQELNYYIRQNYQMAKRSAVLGAITKSSYSICVAGTHGKTTISTMIAHVLRDSGFGCNAFLGGISVNYNSNFWDSENNVSVCEADEYDRSFLTLSPDVAVISSMDPDHLDIYGTKENMESAFADFSSKLKPGGLLITKYGIPDNNISSPLHIRYSLQNNNADAYATDVTMKNGGYIFNVVAKNYTINNVKLKMGGMHNVENAVAAIVIAKHLEIDDEKIRNAMVTFKGVKRRFEYIIGPRETSATKIPDYVSGKLEPGQPVIFIDDYAHHPQELEALVRSAKALFSGRRCTLIFQPHLFSRTRDLAKEFAQSLDLADEVLLLPIYPAREMPIEGVDSKMIAGYMENKNVYVLSKENVFGFIKNDFMKQVRGSANGELLITAGAGDIDLMVNKIKEIIQAS